MWIKDGFITYGYKGWHYFPKKGKISACNQVLAHQHGWANSTENLPVDVNALTVCIACRKVARKATVPVNLIPKTKTTGCGKREFFSQVEADLALRGMGRKTQHGVVRHEQRSYFCSMCNSWHLTSQTKRN